VLRAASRVQRDRRALHGGRFGGGRRRGSIRRLESVEQSRRSGYRRAGGAAIGGIGTILAISSVKAGQRKQFQQGYDQGASDTVKRQYWILQNLQKGKQEPAYRLTYYRFTIPPDSNASVKTVPREIAIPIYE
jgi:hypothetical protein